MITIKVNPDKLKINKYTDEQSTDDYNSNIIKLFEKLIDLIKKANKLEPDRKQKIINNFRIKHLLNSTNVLSGLDYELTLNNVNDLDLPGIGRGTIARIIEILETDNLEEIDELEKVVKTNKIDIITQLNDVVGIGDKRALELIKKYKIKSVEELKDKVNNGEIEVNDKIKLGLKYYGLYKTNIPRNEISQIYIYLQNNIKKLDNKILFIICGSYRRGKLTSGDIDILLLHENIYFQDEVLISSCLTDVVKLLKKINFILDDLTETDGGTKYMGFCKYLQNPVRRIDIRMIGYESFFPALVYFTGSYELNQKMRKLAKEQGYKLNEYGLYDINGKHITIINEETLFEILGMNYLEPIDRN